MNASTSQAAPTLGFLTFVELAQHTVVGGYLIVSRLSRPIEFHCSTPVQANRAHQILYGPTLLPYLYGDRIGRTLVLQSKLRPVITFVDQPEALEIRSLVDHCFLLLPDAEIDDPAARPAAVSRHEFLLGPYRLVARAETGDRDRALDSWRQCNVSWDLREPFQRIRQAIAEAQRAAA
jgi:hypothetical protein